MLRILQSGNKRSPYLLSADYDLGCNKCWCKTRHQLYFLNVRFIKFVIVTNGGDFAQLKFCKHFFVESFSPVMQML